MLPYPEILAACFSQYFIESVFFPGKISSVRNHSIAHWNFECLTTLFIVYKNDMVDSKLEENGDARGLKSCRRLFKK